MRDPDLIIEGEIPIWICDGTWSWSSGVREHVDCARRAVWCQRGQTLGGGTYTGSITCDEHRWRGAITADHVRYWHDRLPDVLPVSS